MLQSHIMAMFVSSMCDFSPHPRFRYAFSSRSLTLLARPAAPSPLCLLSGGASTASTASTWRPCLVGSKFVRPLRTQLVLRRWESIAGSFFGANFVGKRLASVSFLDLGQQAVVVASVAVAWHLRLWMGSAAARSQPPVSMAVEDQRTERWSFMQKQFARLQMPVLRLAVAILHVCQTTCCSIFSKPVEPTNATFSDLPAVGPAWNRARCHIS